MNADMCIRRPRTTWTSCRCDTCHPLMLRMAKLYRTGRYQRVPSEAGWAVIDGLRARGWSGQAIASAAGLPRFTIENQIAADDAGERRTLAPGTCLALINHGDPVAGGVGPTGARRRLRGLARQGYDLATIAEGTGIKFSTLAAIRNQGSPRFIRAEFHTAIRDYTDRVGMTIGPSALASKHAERKRWPGLLAHDDIDDPAERPRTTDTGPRRTAVDEAVVERILAGDTLPTSVAEKREALRRWKDLGRPERELCLRMGWKEGRYADTPGGEVA